MAQTTMPVSAAFDRHPLVALVNAAYWYHALFFCAFFPVLKLAGNAAVLVGIVLACAVVALNLNKLGRAGLVIPVLAALTITLALSLAHLYPKAWTLMFMRTMAVRQWASYFFTLINLVACFLVVRDFGLSTRFPTMLRNGVILLLIGKYATYVMLWQAGLPIAPQLPADHFALSLYSMMNGDGLILLMTAGWMMLQPMSVVARLLICIVLFVYSSSAQSNIAVLLLGLYVLVWPTRMFPVGLAVLLGGFTLAAAAYPADFYHLDDNTGVRAVFWADAMDAALDSNMLGVGFGTEGIRNRFDVLGIGDWRLTMESPAGIYLIGAHNTVYNVLFRAGLPGVVALLFAILPLFRVAGTGAAARFGQFSLCCLIISMSVNMAFESVTFSFSSAFAWAFAAYFSRIEPAVRQLGAALGARRLMGGTAVRLWNTAGRPWSAPAGPVPSRRTG